MTSIATKNGSLIVKDGSIAENCNCCGGCILFKSEGWQGWLADEDSAEINGDGIATLQSSSLPITITVSSSHYVSLSVYVTSNVVRATLTMSSGGEIALESPNASAFLAGDVVQLASVVSNTFPTTLNEYNKPPISAIGSVYLKIEPTLTKTCSVAYCTPTAFQSTYNSATDVPDTPETMTLTFTNVSARPSGPRSSKPSTPYYGGSGDYKLGRYAGFLPPNDVREYFVPFVVRSGCDSFMSRFSQPIILRRVSGTYYTYLSDPIAIKPCTQARYKFDACSACIGYDCGVRPRLSVAQYTQNQGWKTWPTASIFGDYPVEAWDRRKYLQAPDDWKQVIQNASYSFGGFASVAPGGTYSSEPLALCGGTAADVLSLAEGCGGTKCPPSEIQVTIEGKDIPELAGTYSVPLTNSFCTSASGSFIPDNFFDGFRAIYKATFSRGGFDLFLSVIRQPSSSGAFGINYSFPDNCGCESRVLGLTVNVLSGYSTYASTNVPRYADTNPCLPICFDSSQTSVFNNVAMQNFYAGGNLSIGRVEIAFNA
jgi:hypothetical protein